MGASTSFHVSYESQLRVTGVAGHEARMTEAKAVAGVLWLVTP